MASTFTRSRFGSPSRWAARFGRAPLLGVSSRCLRVGARLRVGTRLRVGVRLCVGVRLHLRAKTVRPPAVFRQKEVPHLLVCSRLRSFAPYYQLAQAFTCCAGEKWRSRDASVSCSRAVCPYRRRRAFALCPESRLSGLHALGGVDTAPCSSSERSGLSRLDKRPSSASTSRVSGFRASRRILLRAEEAALPAGTRGTFLRGRICPVQMLA